MSAPAKSNTGAPTLVSMCQNTAIRNLRRFDSYSLGEIPWELLRRIILRVEDGELLHSWETNYPQVKGQTRDIWLHLLKRNFPTWSTIYNEPQHISGFYKIWRKMKASEDIKEKSAEAMLAQRMAQIRKEENARRVAPPTTIIPEKKGRNKGTAMHYQRGSDGSGMRFTTGTKTKDFMQSVRRQAAETRIQHKGVLARPTHLLSNTNSPQRKVLQAPAHMVEDQRRANALREASQRQAEPLQQQPDRSKMSLAERSAYDQKRREDRLKAIREGRAPDSSASPTPSASPPQSPPTTATRIVRTPGTARPSSAATKSAAAASTASSSRPVPASASKTGPMGMAMPVKRPTTTLIDRPTSAKPPSPPSGLKRKPAPTILLPMKRAKR